MQVKKSLKRLFGGLGVLMGLSASVLTWNAQNLKKLANTADPLKVQDLLSGSSDLLFNAAQVGALAATCAAVAIFFDE